MQLLITNDDSFNSPLLKILVESLVGVGKITIVVPKVQQSWTGKAITRFNTIPYEKAELYGQESYIVDCSPASCAQIGIYNLMPQKPDLVISGINMGVNAGVGLVYCSGTVGASLEANIANIPSISLSMSFSPEMRDYYLKNYSVSDNELARLHDPLKEYLTEVREVIIPQVLSNKEAVTYNINFPAFPKEPYKIKPAKLGRSFYKSLYKLVEGTKTFKHSVEGMVHDSGEDVDVTLLNHGVATCTVLDICGIGR